MAPLHSLDERGPPTPPYGDAASQSSAAASLQLADLLRQFKANFTQLYVSLVIQASLNRLARTPVIRQRAILRCRYQPALHAFGPRPAMRWSSRITFRGPPSELFDQSCGVVPRPALSRLGPSHKRRSVISVTISAAKKASKNPSAFISCRSRKMTPAFSGNFVGSSQSQCLHSSRHGVGEEDRVDSLYYVS